MSLNLFFCLFSVFFFLHPLRHSCINGGFLQINPLLSELSFFFFHLAANTSTEFENFAIVFPISRSNFFSHTYTLFFFNLHLLLPILLRYKALHKFKVYT